MIHFRLLYPQETKQKQLIIWCERSNQLKLDQNRFRRAQTFFRLSAKPRRNLLADQDDNELETKNRAPTIKVALKICFYHLVVIIKNYANDVVKWTL